MFKTTFLALAILFILSGCYRVYKPIYIPTKCEIEMPTRPTLSSTEISENMKALLIYTETLEKDLQFCIKGTPSSVKK
ncbi:hypothetical protein [Helicobacter cetorum]|uniref:Putative lipoprotein n=1 Tax=Helicobacter cetorum (strain ATCC BAA-540 / CCUG 52418 / MIT 99-5656) TaxID=1163745 RepID=I0ERV9_HELCM|nr:hypothetical protein [Helicobacter cetorum]AFI05670.1 putative lipoprotein [Helicobacter cetorum MIT 99-5656]AFI05678.1 putative lipoprotein [Helicobacter cetorum MIT 99-5656]